MTVKLRPHFVRVAALLLFALATGGGLFAYSVLTHEEIVDLAWTTEIRPLLLQRFPHLTEDQIKEAHAYAYGGSVIQDLGYYPFGSKEFSDLVHYVRSGDFVLELIRQSQDANEYAFALGALSHYTADIDGHPAVNEAVALRYPKLRAKYGSSVRYAQDTTAHLKTEFGFDTLQVAKNRYRIQGSAAVAGTDLSNRLRAGVEGRAGARGPGGRLVSLLSQPAHSANDQGCARDAQEGIDSRDARLCEEDVCVSPIACRLRAGVGKDLYKARIRHAVPGRSFAIHSEARALQRPGIQQPNTTD